MRYMIRTKGSLLQEEDRGPLLVKVIEHLATFLGDIEPSDIPEVLLGGRKGTVSMGNANVRLWRGGTGSNDTQP